MTLLFATFPRPDVSGSTTLAALRYWTFCGCVTRPSQLAVPGFTGRGREQGVALGAGREPCRAGGAVRNCRGSSLGGAARGCCYGGPCVTTGAPGAASDGSDVA